MAKITCFILIAICLAAVCEGCGNMQFEANEKPEDKVILLETVKESPKSEFQDFKIGDDVLIIEDNGRFEISARVDVWL